MHGAALEGIVTMWRATAAERGDEEMTVEKWRAAYDGLRQRLALAAGPHVTDVDAEGVAAEWAVAPEVDAGRTIVHFHGGGYCIGSSLSHRAMVRHLSVDDDMLHVRHFFAGSVPGADEPIAGVGAFIPKAAA